MNERLTFIAAAATAELAASLLLHAVFPSGPFATNFPSVLTYSGQHAMLALGLWVAILVLGWITYGERLTRPRQNLSTKLRLMGWLGFVGVILDNSASFFLYSTVSEPVRAVTPASEVQLALAERTLFYVPIFAAVVFACYLIGRSHRTIVTPPPRFDRE